MLISYTSTTSKPGCSTLQLGFNDAASFDAYSENVYKQKNRALATLRKNLNIEKGDA